MRLGVKTPLDPPGTPAHTHTYRGCGRCNGEVRQRHFCGVLRQVHRKLFASRNMSFSIIATSSSQCCCTPRLCRATSANRPVVARPFKPFSSHGSRSARPQTQARAVIEKKGDGEGGTGVQPCLLHAKLQCPMCKQDLALLASQTHSCQLERDLKCKNCLVSLPGVPWGCYWCDRDFVVLSNKHMTKLTCMTCSAPHCHLQAKQCLPHCTYIIMQMRCRIAREARLQADNSRLGSNR